MHNRINIIVGENFLSKNNKTSDQENGEIRYQNTTKILYPIKMAHLLILALNIYFLK